LLFFVWFTSIRFNVLACLTRNLLQYDKVSLFVESVTFNKNVQRLGTERLVCCTNRKILRNEAREAYKIHIYNVLFLLFQLIHDV